MKTTEIIIAQFKHINSNFKEYFKIALPLIVGITFIFSGEQIIEYTMSNTAPSGLWIIESILGILIIIYTIFLFFVSV